MRSPACLQKSFSHRHLPLYVYAANGPYMNDYSQEGAGKISLHGNGMGVPSPEDIERRAREIAMIDERNPDEFTETDWAQARKELLGAEHPTPPEETKQSAQLTDDWYVPAPSRGHRVPRPGVDEEEETRGRRNPGAGRPSAAPPHSRRARTIRAGLAG